MSPWVINSIFVPPVSSTVFLRDNQNRFSAQHKMYSEVAVGDEMFTLYLLSTNSSQEAKSQISGWSKNDFKVYVYKPTM